MILITLDSDVFQGAAINVVRQNYRDLFCPFRFKPILQALHGLPLPGILAAAFSIIRLNYLILSDTARISLIRMVAWSQQRKGVPGD